MANSAGAADQLHEAVLQRLQGAGTLRLAIEASELARELAFARLRIDHPGESHRELVMRYLRQTFPAEELPLTLG